MIFQSGGGGRGGEKNDLERSVYVRATTTITSLKKVCSLYLIPEHLCCHSYSPAALDLVSSSYLSAQTWLEYNFFIIVFVSRNLAEI